MTTSTVDNSASRALLGKGSIYTIATAAQLFAALLVQPILSRALPVHEVGRVQLAIAVTALLGLLLTLGLPAVITREYFRKDGKSSASTLVTVGVALAIVLGLVALALGPLWGAPLQGFDSALVLATITAISFSAIATGQAMQRARGQAFKFVAVAAVSVLGGQLSGVAIAVWFNRSATGYLAGVLAGSVLAALLCLAWVKPSTAGITRWSAYRVWFAIALPTIPHTAALYLMQAGDRFVVTNILGDTFNAEYSLAYLTGALGITLVAATNNAWAPLIYGAPDDRRWEILAVTTKDMLRVAAILAGGLAMTAPLALWIITDPSKYDIAELTPVVAITALATVPNVLYLASVHVLFWSGKTAALMWITPLAVLGNLVAKALVLKPYGFVGAAVVTVAAYVLLALLVGWRRRGIAEVPWRGRWQPMVLALVVCIAGALIPLNPVGHLVRAAVTIVLIGLLAMVGKRLLADRKLASVPIE